MKVWFDIDGVVSSFVPNAIRVANLLWPGSVPLDFEPSDYDFTNILTSSQWDKIWDEIKITSDFWLRQGVFPDDVAALRPWLQKAQHEIFFITSRRSTGGVGSRPQTILWLYKHGLYPRANPPTVIAVDGAKKKKKFIEEHRIDFGIDDLPATVAETNMLPWHHCYLMARPWNRHSNLTTVSQLQEFLDIVDSADGHQKT